MHIKFRGSPSGLKLHKLFHNGQDLLKYRINCTVFYCPPRVFMVWLCGMRDTRDFLNQKINFKRDKP
jgi:hypothetical protein